MPRLKTISLRTLLTAKEKLPLRRDDRMEHLLVRFRVPFDAAAISKSSCHLMRGNLVFWFLDGHIHSLELTASHDPSDLMNWCGFDWAEQRDDLLAWCRAEDIPLTLRQEEAGGQLWQTPSGAQVVIQDGWLLNLTLQLHT